MADTIETYNVTILPCATNTTLVVELSGGDYARLYYAMQEPDRDTKMFHAATADGSILSVSLGQIAAFLATPAKISKDEDTTEVTDDAAIAEDTEIAETSQTAEFPETENATEAAAEVGSTPKTGYAVEPQEPIEPEISTVADAIAIADAVIMPAGETATTETEVEKNA